MKIGLSLPAMIGGVTGPEILDWSRRIEADGWDTVGFGERVAYQNLEMFSALSAAAAVTKRVGITATIAVLPMHSEVWVAKAAATIDVLSGGRFTLGVGVGGRSEDYDSLGRPFDHRFQRMDDQVETIRNIWKGATPGEGLDPVGPTPVQRNIPVLSGALGPKSLRRAAGWADGIAGFELDPSPLALVASRDRILDAWDERGSGRPYLMTSFWFALGEESKPRLRRYARDYLDIFGSEMADAMADMTTAYGGENVERSVLAAHEAGYDEIQLVPTTCDVEELQRLASVLADIRSDVQEL